MAFAWLGRRALPAREPEHEFPPVLAVLVGGLIAFVLYIVPVLGFIAYKGTRRARPRHGGLHADPGSPRAARGRAGRAGQRPAPAAPGVERRCCGGEAGAGSATAGAPAPAADSGSRALPAPRAADLARAR